MVTHKVILLTASMAFILHRLDGVHYIKPTGILLFGEGLSSF
jgi:hypothetical protein